MANVMALFAFFGLWETTLAVAAGAASIPVIIHLLNRRRFRIVTWAAMRFLLMAQKQNTRRMRLEQLILLAVRMLIVLLIVLAMASVMPWAERVWAHFWPDGAGFITTRSSRTYKIIVLDGSLSMNLAGAGGKTNFEKARGLAAKMVRESPSGDGFSVVLLKDSPVWVVAEPSQDGRKVAGEIDLLQATHGNAAVSAALNMIAGKLAEVGGRFPSREVYFFTDMQQATWLGGQVAAAGKEVNEKEKTPLQEIQKRARSIFVDVGRDDVGNLAVTDLRVGRSLVTAGALVPISAVVQNFGTEPRKVRGVLLAGKAQEAGLEGPLTLRVEAEERLEVRPGDRVSINFGHKFNAAGLHVVQVRLLGDEINADGVSAPDSLDPDNVRSLIVPVRETVPVMLVNGKSAIDRFDQGTEFLRLALNPFPKDVSPALAPMRPRVISPAQFGDAGEGDLAGYDCVFLCDVPQLGTGEFRRLETHLRQGGGVVISVGERVAENMQAYNRFLYRNDQGLMPAKLEKKIQASADNYFVLQGDDEAFLEAPLKAFADDDDRVSLRSARFRQYLQAKRAADARARTILSFMPEVDPLGKAELDKSLPLNDPAIIEWNPPLPRDPELDEKIKTTPGRYRGKVVLVTTTLNMEWHSWPASPSFGAMMQELVRLAVSGRLPARASQVGQVVEEPIGKVGGATEVRVRYPHPKEIGQRQGRDKAIREGKFIVREFLDSPRKVRLAEVSGLTVLRLTDTDLSGLYLVNHGRNEEELPIAVNVPATTADQRHSESDLARATKEKLRETYAGWDFQLVTDPRNVAAPPGDVDDSEVVRGKLGPAIAHYVLLAVLALLIAEVILAWVFGHYSAAGTPGQAATGALWPALIGGIAIVLFAGGAYVLYDAARTGDFLGFLPDSFRASIESWMSVPPLAESEGRRWDLEFMSYLMGAGNDPWLVAGIAIAAGLLVFFIYRAEAPHVAAGYKWLMAGLRIFIILLALVVLLPQLQLRFDRQGSPDIALIIDDSRSMGEPDHYQEERLQVAAKRFGTQLAERLKKDFTTKMQKLQAELDKLAGAEGKGESEVLEKKIRALEAQRAQLNSPGWRPTRLQVAQAILAQQDNDWLENILHRKRFKLHLFHLDANGRAIRLTDAGEPAGEVTQPEDPQQLERARKAIRRLEAEGKESRLGTAVRQVLDYYRGSSLTAIVTLTDGVTTRDETLGQVAEFAAQKGVPLFFVGIGDDHPIRDLRPHDLKVEDTVYVNDRVIFEANLTGQGYKDLTVPVVLKVKQKDGTEKVLGREMVRVDPTGKPKKVQLRDQPTEPGRRLYIIEVELPKTERGEKAFSPSNTRLERTIDVLELKLIRVLYVEGTPRYEFRFIKSLLERERQDERKNRSFELKVVLLDADPEFPGQDRTALAEFPATKQELDQYDVVIVGDCNPRHPKLGERRLRLLADFVRGEDGQGRRGNKTGGGLLMIAGPNFSPHSYRDTALADVLPVEPNPKVPVEPDERLDSYRLQVTPAGRHHPSFRFSSDDAENQAIMQRLAPMYWWSDGYRIKPLAEVLAVHPGHKAQSAAPGQDVRHPLAVQQFVGSGRCMFFGFDETWRWRFREHEIRFNHFWIQTMRYLSRSRITRTVLRLDRQTPYRVGEPIAVTVQFPDNAPRPGKQEPKFDLKDDVKVIVEYRPEGDDRADPENQTLNLKKVKGSLTSYEGLLTQTREGKYHFWLSSPDVSKEDPSGQKPSADARVDRPPGELDRLRMNQEEMTLAAEATRGKFYNIADANTLLDELPAGVRVSLNASRPPCLLWNHMLMFALVLFLLTGEWLLRKRKHML